MTESGCWIWTGACKELGYGVIGLGSRSAGTAKAHRVSYTLYYGDIPDGMNVLHKCDVPCCCNPRHLYLGTLKDNAQDTVRRGRLVIPDNRGERASWAKLCREAVIEIRSKAKTGVEYARQFGVSKSAIYAIWCGDNWRSVR